MEVHSLGYRTDLIFPAYEGEIVDRGDYLVIHTPSNPSFYWGNYLLFPGPPKAGDYDRWRGLFTLEIGAPPQVQHQTFGWDTTRNDEGISQPFLETGFRLNRSTVMVAGELPRPQRPATGADARLLQSDRDWELAVENQVICREPEFDEAGYRGFRRREMARYRAMAADGLGAWFGAFAGEQLIADLGLFHDGELGRYQSVQTHPDYRRRGYAGALLYAASRYAVQQFHIKTLVIVSKEGSEASRLYQSAGFQPQEYQMGLEFWIEGHQT